MKRSTFFKLLFGIALIPVASQFNVTKVKAKEIKPKEIKDLKPIKMTGGSSDHVSSSDYNGFVTTKSGETFLCNISLEKHNSLLSKHKLK